MVKEKNQKAVLLLSVALVLVCFIFISCAKKQMIKEEPAAVQTEEITAPAITESPAEEPEMDEETLRSELRNKVQSKLQDIFFDYDRYDLSALAKQKMESNAVAIKDNSLFTIIIEGHCDERGTTEYNLVLGEKRASAAKNYLVSLGVDEKRLNAISYGEERPFDAGHNEVAWAKNRRAHFVVE